MFVTWDVSRFEFLDPDTGVDDILRSLEPQGLGFKNHIAKVYVARGLS